MTFQKLFLLFFFGITSFISAGVPTIEKTYSKEFYENGHVKSEGWLTMDIKTDYWIYYHPNGVIKAKGHFKNNKKTGYWYFYSEINEKLKEGHYYNGLAEQWWIFYDIANEEETKFQYKKNKKNGFALIYKNNRLIRAEKYKDDTKIGEWTSVIAFKRDNPNVTF